MATWKKLVVSGSAISQLNNDSGYITAAAFPNSFATASFNGTDILANASTGSINFASGSDGLLIAADAGTRTLTFSLDAVPNSSLANSEVHISGSSIGGTSIALGATGSIDVGVDDTTIESVGGNLRIKDNGVTFAKMQDIGDNRVIGRVGAGSSGDPYSIQVLDEDNMSSNSATSLATQQSIKAYVDSQVGASALTITGSGATDNSLDLDTEDLIFAGATGAKIGIEMSASAGPGDVTITAGLISGSIANSRLANDHVVIGQAGNKVVLGGSYLTDGAHAASGSFSGSFEGDGSGLTGIASTLSVSASLNAADSSPDIIDIALKTESLTIQGTQDEIEVNAAGNVVTVSLPDDVVINGDLIVQGTASFNNEQTLLVEDRFILLASGSTSAGDGGIVVQGATQNIGEVFGFDNDNTRWAVASAFNASGTDMTAAAFMANVLTGNASSDSAIDGLVDNRYEAKGNIFIGDDEGIWIYS